MHELALAENMLDIAKDELARHGCSRLKLLRVEVGAISGVVTDSLLFGFEALTRGSVHEGAVLDIVRVPLRLACGVCGTEFEGESLARELSPCPGCGEVFGHRVLSGRELQVTWIEGE
ncbi:MAG: hydrogenase maturation nickel metallochaperone HypA [Desulfovibrionaceae bacterium]|nr:hydrogenase maturation nickel metallochaperone HypA [Desulfovibrionaceae bacterium]